MKIVFIADIHIKLGQKNVPKDWQRNRILQLASEINKEPDVDYIIIGGDLLDVANPSIEEIGLMYEFLTTLNSGGYIIPGNHELYNKTRDCFNYITLLLASAGFRTVREFESISGIDYIPYNILHKEWPTTRNKLAVTHVRGEIPPHVLPEIDLDKYKNYDKVFAGDLHSNSNSQGNILYPGSPITTSFHRTRSTGNGYFCIYPETGEHSWVQLNLPQLIKTTVNSEADIIPTEYDHTVYELEGNLDQLAGVKANKLLSKKVTRDISTPSKLSLQGNVLDELAVYLEQVKGIDKVDVPKYISLFKSIVND